jgi:hypothetical protein
MDKLLRFILSPINLLKLVFVIILVFIFWMLESTLMILHYVLDTPLRWILNKIEKLIKLLIKQLK